jgi:hypothetical protein
MKRREFPPPCVLRDLSGSATNLGTQTGQGRAGAEFYQMSRSPRRPAEKRRLVLVSPPPFGATIAGACLTTSAAVASCRGAAWLGRVPT